MTADAASPPLWTADLPGVAGRIKEHCEDFEVEEIPAYEPSGEGDHLYLWVQKRDVGAEYLARLLAKKLDIRSDDIGTAGMKDRRAVTRQWVSVPAKAEPLVGAIDDELVQVLKVSRHVNKLRAGHLRGNRFRVLVRGIGEPTHGIALKNIVDRIAATGLPNYYGPQRFGHDGETGRWGLALLRGERIEAGEGQRAPNLRNSFLKRLVLSAGQSVMFNAVLGQRVRDGLFRSVLDGDVMAKWPFGGMFVAEDVPAEQARFDARETVTAGPIFGRKTFKAAGTAAERERQVFDTFGLKPTAFDGFGKLVEGTRRHNVIYFDDMSIEWRAEGAWLSFALPAGSYATVLLREVMKTDVEGEATDE